MDKSQLLNRCSVNTNTESDSFVGIRYINNKFCINFPLGYNLSQNEDGLKKDIILLLNTIKNSTQHMDSKISTSFYNYSQIDFPYQACLYLIHDYLKRGYYNESQFEYKKSKQGKIDWSRTIKTISPSIQNDKAFYLDFSIKKSSSNENALITLIHQYCVYDSFEKLGWLFTNQLPTKSPLKFDYRSFKKILLSKLQSTFEDKNKILFRNMIALIDYESDNHNKVFIYGTYKFEYVWETIINTTYGVQDKKSFFPKTQWILSDGSSHRNSHLVPDTIMLHNGNVFILDAKYYRYSYSKSINDLPNTSSIHKQITYGEYIQHTQSKIINIYNSFILPFDSEDVYWDTNQPIKILGEAISDWKIGSKKYEHVIGILIDTKYLMSLFSSTHVEEKEKLAQTIQSFFD